MDHDIKFQYQNGKTKTKIWENVSGLQIGEGFKDCKSGQEGLQIGPALGISNQGKRTTNRGRYFKLDQRDFKSWQKLQIAVQQLLTIKFLY